MLRVIHNSNIAYRFLFFKIDKPNFFVNLNWTRVSHYDVIFFKMLLEHKFIFVKVFKLESEEKCTALLVFWDEVYDSVKFLHD